MRLKRYREAMKMTQYDLGREAGIEQATISRIERGEMAIISPHAPRLADALGIPVADLLGLDSNVVPAPIGTRRIPVLDYIQAGKWTGVSTPMEENDDSFECILTDLQHSARSFAMIIRGDSMQPDFRPGDKIVVDPAIQPRPGDFVVASREEGGEACFKQYRSLGVNEHGDDIFELIPLNNLYPSLRSDRQQVKIVGTMVEHRRFRGRAQ